MISLLERWDYSILYGSQPFTNDEIRRAIAIAQAVDDRVEIERAKNSDCRSEGVNWIMRRADELLEGKK